MIHCVFNVHSLCIQYTFNAQQYTRYLANANSHSYPNSRDAIASKKWNSPFLGHYLILPFLVNSIFLGYHQKHFWCVENRNAPKKSKNPILRLLGLLLFSLIFFSYSLFFKTMQQCRTYISGQPGGAGWAAAPHIRVTRTTNVVRKAGCAHSRYTEIFFKIN